MYSMGRLFRKGMTATFRVGRSPASLLSVEAAVSPVPSAAPLAVLLAAPPQAASERLMAPARNSAVSFFSFMFSSSPFLLIVRAGRRPLR